MSSAKWGPFCLGLNVLNSVARLITQPYNSPYKLSIMSLKWGLYFTLGWMTPVKLVDYYVVDIRGAKHSLPNK